MKISNEAKVGVLAIAAILVLVFGFNFLKGKNIFSRTPTIYAVFEEIGSLKKANEVKINGLPVGTVYDLMPTDREVNKIIVEIHLSRDISIPRNSVAFIDGALVGDSYVNIEKGTANTYLEAGDTISTRLDQGLMASLQSQLSPTVTRVNQTLDSLKLIIGNLNSIFDPNTNNNLQTMIARLSVASAHLQTMLDAQTGALAQSLNNMNSVTGNLARNNEAITSSIRNVELTTSSLANARIQETVAALEGTIIELRGTAEQLKGSVNRINSTDGTLGLLMNDRKLYDQIQRAALGLEILLDDVRVHPKRYVNISVFGGKGSSEPLTSPSVKDTIPRTH
jgi:phospholipid/cholesterol/gamma-HCH transport system substrate-binding protein